MSAGMAHQPTVTTVSTPVGARWVMSCPACPAHTPPMSRQAAELAQERHAWEYEPTTAARGAVSSSGRRGRSV
jgi:hypothetical protein